MKKIIKKFSVLILIFAMMAPFIPVFKVNALEEDTFGLNGNVFAIITKDSFQVTNSGKVQETYLALTDSYNEAYRKDGQVKINPNSIGGKKVLKDDLNCTNPLTTCTVEDNGVTFWFFELDKSMEEKLDEKDKEPYKNTGNTSSTLDGHFKWYNIYTMDASGNKKYLNLSFGGDEGNKVEVSSKAEPIAVTKLNNNEGYVLWGYHTRSPYFNKTAVNILMPDMEVGKNNADYNRGLFGARDTFTKDDNNLIFVLAKPGFETKKLTSTPSEIKNNTSFNAKINLYNYNRMINYQRAGVNGFKFYNGNNSDTPLQIAQDGYGSTYSRGLIGAELNYDVEALLGKDGYPVTSLGSLNYLFNDEVVEGKTIAGKGIDASSLFQVDNKGYYYYDSAKNAAYFNGNKFVLYNAVVRPEYTLITGTSTSGKVDYTTDERKGNFLPFNKIDKSTISPYDVTKTSTGINAYKLTGQNEGVADLWFGLTIEDDFYMPEDGMVNGEDMKFSFYGDDNVLVYIDNALVLDYTGGEEAYINFKTGEVADSKHAASERSLGQILKTAGINSSYIDENTLNSDVKHEIKIFHIERGGNLSSFNMKMNLLQSIEVDNPATGIDFNGGIVGLFIISLILLIVTKKRPKYKNI